MVPDHIKSRCWASVLGGCDEKISSEHIISQALFEKKMIMVQGFSWCLDKPKSIAKAGLTRNILCRTHNSKLSDLGVAAQDAFNVFREATRLMEVRKDMNVKSFTFMRYSINGRLLERWFLKTLINLAWDGKLIIGPGKHNRGTPSGDLVEIAFGRREFPSPAGLYLSAIIGENITLEDRVNITTKSEGNNLVAAEFLFRGCKFFLSLLPIKFTTLGHSQLLYRDTNLIFRVHNRRLKHLPSYQVRFVW